MNNRKQKVYSMLDSLTSKELEDYMSNKKINSNFDKLLQKLRNNKPETHFNKHLEDAQKDFGIIFNKYYKLGVAWVIALVLECFYNDKYKIKDIQSYMKNLIKDDDELKEYVYDIMKDF